MKTTVNFYAFTEAFKQLRPNNFSYSGLSVLFAYLEEMEESCGEETELDVIGLCCEYSEDTPENIAKNYSIDIDTKENAESLTQQVCDFLEYHTSVVGVTDDGTIVYADF